VNALGRTLSLALLAAAAVIPLVHDDASAAPETAAQRAVASVRTLDDYKHFRTAMIDLVGRAPTRDEIASFEKSSFDFDAWVDKHLEGPAYAARLTRIYMDLLRLEPNVNFSSGPSQLFRQDIQGPDGKPVSVFYRGGQRRERLETDGKFCFTEEESGLVVRPNAKEVGTPIPVNKKLLDKYTVLVKPWWLYKDYRAKDPKELFGREWTDADAEYHPVESLLNGPDGKPVTAVRICREEAQTAETGTLFVRPPPPASAALMKPGEKPATPVKPGGKPAPLAVVAAPGKLLVKPPPKDRPFAKKNEGQPVACATRLALTSSIDCGCGVGLERCMPNDGPGQGNAFYFPNHEPLGPALPLDGARQQAQRWFPYWWSRESQQFLSDIFTSDRDFRQILTGKQTFVNGPLAQFYRDVQRGGCCGPEANFGMREEKEPLFDPSRVPAGLAPQDTGTWTYVADRGAHAAGLLTQPMFLEKYASARARGAVLYNAFLCKSFNAEQAQLTPSEEPNLMKRPGCQACHATLEPLAAYFSRVEQANFVYLPRAEFPVVSDRCKKDKNGKLNGACNALYDVSFIDGKTGDATLRSAYGSPAHADEGPEGAGRDITASPDFASCAVSRVASSFLGRQLDSDDAVLLDGLTRHFVASGYKMRTLVRDVVRSNEYRHGNDSGGAR
jgi:hypothetical protein